MENDTVAPEAQALAPEAKAYDLKLLLGELKGQGLELAEDGAEKVAKATFSWLKKSAEISATPYDNIGFAAALPEVEKLVFKAIDKIDGHEG